MKTKLLFLILTILFNFNLVAQDWECGTEEESNQYQTENTRAGCDNQSDTWINKYRTPGFWVPNENTPLKTILVNIIVCQDDAGENNWEDTQETRDIIDELYETINDYYGNIPQKEYALTCEPTIDDITDSRVRFEINRVIFIQNTAFNQTSWNPFNILDYIEVNYPDDYRKALNHIVTNVTPNSGGWGYYSYSNSRKIAYVHTRFVWGNTAPFVEQYPEMYPNHFAHEYGHALGLHHTYNSEIRTIAHYDFLNDILGECAEAGYCDSNNLPLPGNICYLKGDFFYPQPTPYPLMSGTYNARYISPKYAGRMHRALSHYNNTFKLNNKYMHQYIKEKHSFSVPKYVTENETWDFAIKLYQDIIVTSGNTLTLSCEVRMPIDGKIIVEPGAKLIIDGAVLMPAHSEPWQGIEIHGNKNLPQTEANQGVIEIINGGTIKNAETAIYVGNQNLVNDTQTGGIVRIEDAVFTNNRYGVYFANYRASENQSYIKNSIFKITEEYPQYPYNSSPRAAVYLWDVGNIAIEGNTFINESDLASSFGGKRGIGVKAVDADFSLVPSTTAPNQFINLYQGVVVENTADNSSCTIDSNSFTGNLNAIYLNNTNSVKITSNIIDLGIDYTFDNKISGIYLKGSNYFQIEANEIINTLTTSHNETVGIYINECNNVNEIYRNEFSDINTGVFSDGINAGDANGLQIIYNIFNDVENDIYVAPESQIAPNQGSIRETAGNQFIPECSGSFNEFYNNGNQISYYKEDVPKYIPDCNYQVNLFTGLVANECASKLEKPTDYEDKMLLADNDINQRQTDLEVLTDGGDTQTLNETVDEAENNEALSLRNELLSKSPTLSDTVMVNTTSIESVLPSLMVKQVLAANPKAAKSSVVQTALDERQNPLPEYMRAEIDLGKDTLSYKEELESRLSSAINARENLIDRKILYLKQEGSFESLDTLKNILLAEATTKLNRSYQLVDFYLSQDNAQEAQNLFTALPTNFNLSSSQQNKYNKLNQLYSIRFNLESADKSWFEMTASQKGVIETLAIDSTSTAGMQSRAVLSLVDDINYGIYIPDVDTSNYQTNSYNGAPEMLFKAYPQVATDYFIIEYVLGENENPEEVTMAVFDDKGKQLKSFEVINHENQFLIECENWKEGVYWCRKSVRKRVTEQEKVIINKGGIVIDSVETNSVKGTNSLVLFPNPSSGYLFVSFTTESTTEAEIQVTDVNGVLIGTYKLKNNLTKITTNKWKQGIYMVTITSNNKIEDSAKIIVE